MTSFLEKATSAFNEAKESATSSAESVSASLTDVQKNVAVSTETVKTDAATAPEKLLMGLRRDAVEDNAVSGDTEGAKSLLLVFEEKRNEVSPKLVGAVTNASDGAPSSTTVASRDLLVSTDNQVTPLLASGDRGVETTTCWKECCGVLELMAASNMRNGAPRR